MRNLCFLLAILMAGCWSDKLSAPTGVQASQGVYADQIDISWNEVDGADSYRVFRYQNQTASYELIGFIDAQYTATFNSVDSPPEYPIVPGEHYYYKVAAVDGAGEQGGLSERAEGWAEILVPLDFAVNLWWRKGSGVPYPGVLTSYDVDIDSSLQGTASFSYHEADPRVETFAVTSGQFEDLYNLMLTHDMFRDLWSENPRPPYGGATESMSLTVDGGTFGPPTFPGSDEEISDKRAAMEAVRALVPEDLWD